jgi:hypothetical protein
MPRSPTRSAIDRIAAARLWLARRWSLGAAETLDRRGKFDEQVREALDEALVAVGESPLDAPGSDAVC